MDERDSDGGYVFRRGSETAGCMVVLAAWCLVLAAYPYYDLLRGNDNPWYFIAGWDVLMVGLAFMCVRGAEPFELRLYPDRRTYKLTQGYPGLKRSRPGT